MTMTEQDWLTSEDPKAILRYLTHERHECEDSCGDSPRARPLISDRKLRLFACAVSRLIGPLAGERIEDVEAWADGGQKPKTATRWILLDSAHEAATFVCDERFGAAFGPTVNRQAEKAAILRDIIGNPFREMPRCWWCLGDGKASHESDDRDCTVCGGSGHALPKSVVLWNNSAVRRIAQGIYDESRFEDMSILADAMEDAGCQEETILRHCRGQIWCPQCSDWKAVTGGKCVGCGLSPHTILGPHVRGCHVLDLVLGLS